MDQVVQDSHKTVCVVELFASVWRGLFSFQALNRSSAGKIITLLFRQCMKANYTLHILHSDQI